MNAQLLSSRSGRNAFHLVIALLVVVAGARCDSENNNPLTAEPSPPISGEPSAPTTGTIQGTVVTPSPQIGTDVTVRLTGSGNYQSQTVVTNFGILLTFHDLPPGVYSIVATAPGFNCRSMNTEVQAGRTTVTSIPCTFSTGTVTGSVRTNGAPIGDASVSLTGGGILQTKTTDANGTFAFAVPAGEYAVTVSHQHYTCSIVTVSVEWDRTTTADIECTGTAAGAISGAVIIGQDAGYKVPGATVTLSGPESRTTSASASGTFAFEQLPSGAYSVAATARALHCPPVSVVVHPAVATATQISCGFRPPFGSEIRENWVHYRQLESQAGSCPAQLPESGSGSMTFNPSNDAVAIVGLDPALTIVGTYHAGSGNYMGTGAAVLGDGSSIQTQVVGFFAFDPWDLWDFYFTVNALTRQHRDANGNLICTEIYRGWSG